MPTRYFNIEETIICLIIIMFFASNCSPKHLISKEDEILSREIVKSWVELQSEIVRLNQKEILINLKEIECRAIKDSIKRRCLYKSGKKDENGEIRRDYELGIAQLLGGLAILGTGSQLVNEGCLGEPEFNFLKVIGGAIIATGGCFLMQEWPKQLRTEEKISIPEPEEKILCKEKRILADELVTVSLKDRFEKKYITDSLGNILINGKELIPYISKPDSNVILNIKYKNINTKIFIQ
jgi:hypothetical protein